MTNKQLMELPIAQAEAENLYFDLSGNKLKVKLSGQPGDHNRERVVYSKNPRWYADIFSTHYNGARRGKQARSGFRRCRVLRILIKMSNGTYKNFFVYETLADLIRDRLYNGYYIEEEGIHVPPQLQKEPWEN